MEDENIDLPRRMESGEKDLVVHKKSGSQTSLKKNISSRPIDSGVDSGLYTSDTDSNSRSLSSNNSAEIISSVSSSTCSNHKAIRDSNSHLHCSSSLSTTRHLHSGGRHSSSSFDSQSQSVHSCDSGFSDKRRASLSDIKSTGHPSYYPLFAHVLHRQKNCSDFPSNLSLVISDFEHGHSFKYKSEMVSGSAFGIEIYHNARSRDLPHLVVALSAHEQLSRAASQFLRLSRNWAKNSMAEMTLGSLERVQLLGRGGYAHVELVRDIDGETYALKCINKSRVVAAGQRRHVKAEREILLNIDSSFILKLHKTFRDKKYVYLLTEALLGGELFTMMKRAGPLNEEKAKFALACVLEAIEYLHNINIVHRDVKPENMLLNETGYVKLADFGFAKKLGRDSRTRTFCGTPGYLAPELLVKRPHGYPADFWSIGVFLFELLSCKSPFRRHTDSATYKMTMRGIRAVEFPSCINPLPTEIIKGLCTPEPEDRLGSREGVAELRATEWLRDFKFNELRRAALISPLKPDLDGPLDTSQFDEFSVCSQDTPPDETSGWDEDF